MKTPILGSSYVARSVNAADNQLINLYPEAILEGGKEAAFFNRCPGSRVITNIGDGPIRGMWAFGANAYVASGAELYKIDQDFNITLLGAIGGVSQVSMADNGYQLFVATNPQGYIYNANTNTFAEITDPDFPGAQQVTFMYGLFIFNEPNSQKFWITGYDGTQIDPLEFSFAEINPDLIQAIIANNTELWIFGTNSIEVWYYNADPDFPFAPIQGAYNEIGCAAPFSVAKLDNTLFWLGQDARGNGIVYRAQGYNAMRVSTHAIEYAIQQYEEILDAVAYTYQQDGHSFYVLTFPSANATWVYDVATGAWHQRAFFQNGQFYRHRSNCMVNFQNRILVGDYQDGRLYELDLDYYLDDQDRMRWLRSWRALPEGANNYNRTAHHTLQVDMESGAQVSEIPTSYLYIRVRVLSNWTGADVTIDQITIRNVVNGPSIAVGGTPFASAGNPNGVFTGAYEWRTTMSVGAYVGYEFASPVAPVEVQLKTAGNDGVRGFIVEGSNDGVTYTALDSDEMPFTANLYPKIGTGNLIPTTYYWPYSVDALGTEADSQYIYVTTITAPTGDNTYTGTTYQTDTYDLNGNLISSTSGTWTSSVSVAPPPTTFFNINGGMVSNTKDYWFAADLGGFVAFFHQDTWIMSVQTPPFGWSGVPYWGNNTCIKAGNAFYFSDYYTYGLYKVDIPAVPGVVTSYSGSYPFSYRSAITYDPVLNDIWMVCIENVLCGQTFKFDTSLNLVSSHPIGMPEDAFSPLQCLTIYNGIGVVQTGLVYGTNDTYSIRDYTVANGVAPIVIRNEPCTPNSPTVPANLLNGLAYFNSVLIDLTGTPTARTFSLTQIPSNLNVDPVVMLRWSDDGGHTWSNYHTKPIGKLGEFGKRIIWRRLGMTMKLRDRVYELSCNDPIKTAIMGAELDLSGTSS